jgi:hypothetical protein
MITEETARKQLETLPQEGSALAIAFSNEEEAEPFETAYQRWVRGMPRTTVQGKHGRAGRRSRMHSRVGGVATPVLGVSQ